MSGAQTAKIYLVAAGADDRRLASGRMDTVKRRELKWRKHSVTGGQHRLMILLCQPAG